MEKLPPNIVACLSQGRSGTKYLNRVLGLFTDIASLHEPQPDFTAESAAAQYDPGIAEKFVLQKKIPALSRFADFRHYAETSHMWCAGVAEAWISLGITPVIDAIVLNRDTSLIARSMYELGIVPGVDPWYFDPLASRCLLEHSGHDNWGNYHRCYAYCLEIEARKRHLGRLISAAGGRVVSFHLEELSTWRGLFRLRKELDLPRLRANRIYSFCFLKRMKVNNQSYVKRTVSALSLGSETVREFEEQVARGAREKTCKSPV